MGLRRVGIKGGGESDSSYELRHRLQKPCGGLDVGVRVKGIRDNSVDFSFTICVDCVASL